MDCLDNLKYRLENEYNFNSDILEIKSLRQYPHIFKIYTEDETYIVKLISRSQTNFDDINLLYLLLEKNENILLPEKTKTESYSFNLDEKIVLLYKMGTPIKISPEANWWAESLNSIHLNNPNNIFNNSFSPKIYDQTVCLLKDALNYIEEDIKEKVKVLFNQTELNNKIRYNSFVLCHNDPYVLNIVEHNKVYRMIDTEGMGFAPLEYDIQRLFYNQALICEDIQQLESFWQKFITKYENLSRKKIDLKLLKNIYLCDFIRSISWLYLVSNKEERLDRERQGELLKLYKNSIRNDMHVKILKKI